MKNESEFLLMEYTCYKNRCKKLKYTFENNHPSFYGIDQAGLIAHGSHYPFNLKSFLMSFEKTFEIDRESCIMRDFSSMRETDQIEKNLDIIVFRVYSEHFLHAIQYSVCNLFHFDSFP